MGSNQSNDENNSNNLDENGNEFSSTFPFYEKNNENSPISPKIKEKNNENSQLSKIEEEGEQDKENEEFNFLPKIEKEREQPKTPEMQINFNNIDEIQKDEKEKHIIVSNKEEPQMSTNFETKESTKKITKIVSKLVNISIKADFGSILDLKKIARNTLNVIYNPRDNNFLTKYLEGTNISANIFSSGKLVCTGIKSKDSIRKVIHKFGKIVRKVGHQVIIKNVEITNMIQVYNVNFTINLRTILNNLESLTKKKINKKNFIPKKEIFQELLLV